MQPGDKTCELHVKIVMLPKFTVCDSRKAIKKIFSRFLSSFLYDHNYTKESSKLCSYRVKIPPFMFDPTHKVSHIMLSWMIWSATMWTLMHGTIKCSQIGCVTFHYVCDTIRCNTIHFTIIDIMIIQCSFWLMICLILKATNISI